MFHSPVGISNVVVDDDGRGAEGGGGTWPKSLRATLDHPHNFGAFYRWLSGRGRAHVLEFWLAIWAFRRAWAERDPRARRIGIAFHRRFVSPRTGCCDFLPASLRAERSAHLLQQQQSEAAMREHFFDACAPYAWQSLAREHMQFVLLTDERRGGHNGDDARNGADVAAQHQPQQFVVPSASATDHQRQLEMEADEECGREAAEERCAFALQLVHKLNALAAATRRCDRRGGMPTAAEAVEYAGGGGADDACDYEDDYSHAQEQRVAMADTALTPERMCEWMRFASVHSGCLTALSSSGYYADGKWSSACSSTAGGYMTLKPTTTTTHDDMMTTRTAATTTTTTSGVCASSSSRCSMMGSAGGGGGGGTAQMTITYREAGGAGSPPFVVRVSPQAVVTFREFRRLFAIPLRSNKRFLFKEHRFEEQPSSMTTMAHFQWTAIYEDDSPLPIFFGQIVAECRTLSESD